MARNKDSDWSVDKDSPTMQGAMLCVLMDIRDELKQLNRVFECSNFQSMPHNIRRTREAAERTDRRLQQSIKLPQGRVKK